MLTLKEAAPELIFQPVFDEIRRTLYPVYRYLQGNCHCNAHLASLILRSRGVAHKKIWIFAPSRYSAKSNESFRIYDRNEISPNGWINWGYHVAPMVTIEGQDFIFDYNFSETSPLTLPEWLSHFCLNKFKCVIEDADNFLFYTRPEDGKQVFNNSFYPLEGECLENNWLEKGLAVNETALTMYQDCYLNALKNGAEEEPLEDYRQLIGRILNFECVFREQGFNKKMTREFQFRHQDLIRYYRGVYEDNVVKWKRITAGYKF